MTPQPAGLGTDPADQRLEELGLPGRDPLVSLQDLLLVLLQLGRHEALATHDRLLALVVRRHQAEVGLADLDVVAEDPVEADLERGNPGAAAARAPRSGDRGAAPRG